MRAALRTLVHATVARRLGLSRVRLLADADSHTLAELAVTSQQAIDRRDTVEIGWTVDRRLNGDDSPHLFAFHRVAGNGAGYNGQGFVPQPGAAEKPGALLVPGSVHKFMIKHFQGNWWIGDNDTWFGRYPDSLWLHLDEIREYNGPAAQVFPVWDNNLCRAAKHDSDGITYGGPAACGVARLIAVPQLIGLTPDLARNAILQSGGLKVGTITAVQQLDCTGQVISQSRAGGSTAPIGSLVDFEYSLAFPGQVSSGPPVQQ